jgi:hypothetical protein
VLPVLIGAVPSDLLEIYKNSDYGVLKERIGIRNKLL